MVCYTISIMSDNLNIHWEEVIKKEARGINDADLGEVQEIMTDKVITERGLVEKSRFAIPKSLISHFDGHNLVFNLSEKDALKYAQQQ